MPNHSRYRSWACPGTGPCERNAGMPSPFTLCLAARGLPPGWSPRSYRLRWFLPDLSALSPGHRSLRRGFTPERPPSTM
eukprot:7275486-Pyramimonas_sp.AAC.1